MDTLHLIIESLLGGGLIATLATLRYARQKARHEAQATAIGNKQQEMELAKSYVDEYFANIIKPLQTEVRGLRRDVTKLRNAIEKIPDCAYSAHCPVRTELQHQQELDAHEPHDPDPTEPKPL